MLRRGADKLMNRVRVRHHTGDMGLDGIRVDNAIAPSRGWASIRFGVHVEMPPFGTTQPERRGYRSPKADLGIERDGAFVEFDLPGDAVVEVYSCGPRKTAVILTDKALALAGLNPVFVKVRRHWWEFWRTRPE